MASNITYEEALSTLDSMFGEPWTQDHLDSVLRHFQGHMENTVEAVLGHGNGSPDALLAKLNSGSYAHADRNKVKMIDTSHDAEYARQLADDLDAQDRQRQQGRTTTVDNAPPRSSYYPGGMPPSKKGSIGSARTPAPTTSTTTQLKTPSETNTSQKVKPNGKKWIGTPTDLPPDFLRVTGVGTNGISDLATDEALARMLQDSLFTEELANNPEFAHLARGRPGNQPGLFPGLKNQEGPNIIKNLSDMGESAKKKLSLLAAQWNAKMNANNPNDRDTERRGLLDDAAGAEENTASGRNVEMKSMGFSWRGDQGKKQD